MQKFLAFIFLTFIFFSGEGYSKNSSSSLSSFKEIKSPTINNPLGRKRFNTISHTPPALSIKRKPSLKRTIKHSKITKKKVTNPTTIKNSRLKTRKAAPKAGYQSKKINTKKTAKQKPKSASRKKIQLKKSIYKAKSPPPSLIDYKPQQNLPIQNHFNISYPLLSYDPHNISSLQEQLDREFPLKLDIPAWQAPQWQETPITYPKNYFSCLNKETQMNVKIGGLDHLFSKNLFGQNQTIATIEISGTWNKLTENIHFLPFYLQNIIRYRFLPPVSGPHIAPNKGKVLNNKLSNHGSQVASVLLDLAPQAHILPISTYISPSMKNEGKSYDMADALMDLSKQSQINVINLSTFHFHAIKDSCLLPSKYVQAIKTVVKSGKAIVIAAGNTGTDFQTLHPINNDDIYLKKFFLHLFEKLDIETRKSIILAGNLNPENSTLDPDSTRPGSMLIAQESFLCAPGKVRLSYEKEKSVHIPNSPHLYYSYQLYTGTSYAAPYISATIADILSKSKTFTPRQVVQALLETAEKSDARIYGRGIIRADKALQYLENHL